MLSSAAGPIKQVEGRADYDRSYTSLWTTSFDGARIPSDDKCFDRRKRRNRKAIGTREAASTSHPAGGMADRHPGWSWIGTARFIPGSDRTVTQARCCRGDNLKRTWMIARPKFAFVCRSERGFFFYLSRLPCPNYVAAIAERIADPVSGSRKIVMEISKRSSQATEPIKPRSFRSNPPRTCCALANKPQTTTQSRRPSQTILTPRRRPRFVAFAAPASVRAAGFC